MKGKLLKKVIASVSAVSMLAPMAFALPASAAEIYKQDYESVTDASTVMTSQNAQGLVSMGTDNTNYLQFVGNSTENSRSSYSNFDVDLSQKDEFVLEFDAALTTGNKDASQIIIRSGNIPKANSGYDSSQGYILRMDGAANTPTWTLNEVSSNTVSLTGGTWYHFKVFVDKSINFESITITDTTTQTPVVEKLISPYSGDASKITGLYWLNGRYNCVNKIDNIVVRDVEDSDEFGELPSEELNRVDFTAQVNQVITAPAEDEPVHIPITVKATGTLGNDLTAESTVEWSTMGLEQEDGYISLTAAEGTENGTTGDFPGNVSTAYFNVRNGVGNYFGNVTAKVTYKEKTISISTPFAVIGGASAGTNIAPAPGYPENMNDFQDDLVGYQATATGLTDRDIVLNNWSIYGSNGLRTLTLKQDEDATKYLQFHDNGGNGSTVGVYQLADQPSQYIVDMKVRGSNVTFGHYDNTSNNKDANPAWSGNLSGGEVKINGVTVASGLPTDDWARIVVSCDESAVTAWAKVYKSDGTLAGENSDPIPLNSANAVDSKGNEISPTTPAYNRGQRYFCIAGSFPVDLASFRIYYPTVGSLEVTGNDGVVQIPEDDTKPAVTKDLSAVVKDTDGNKITGAVTWSLAEDYAGITIEPDSENKQNAVLTVTNEAGPGEITVVASYGSTRKEVPVTLSASGNVMVFTKTTSSITIPFEEPAVTQVFTAEAKDKSGATIDADVTYEMVDAANQAVTATGITFDAATGTLSVAPNAASKVVYIKASATVGDETLSARTKVNIHGLSFAFGSDEPTDETLTQVTSADAYTDRLGYGFADTSAVADETADVKGSAAYTFKAKVPNGNYKVAVTTSASSMISEVVEGIPATTGISKSGSQFDVAVADGVLDLTFPADSTLSKLTITQTAPKEKREKPMLYAIGDSTTNSNDPGKSWGNWMSENSDQLPDVFSGFSNNGMAGRDSVNFYNQGRVETVLLAVAPGDYVTVNMGINSREAGESASFYTLLDLYYVNAIIQRGAIPIIVTATPQGPVNGHEGNYSNGKFNCNRGDGAHNGDLRSIAEKYSLNVIELGQYGDTYFNAIDDAFIEDYNEKNSTSFDNALSLVQSWYPDHNHYRAFLGEVFARYITGEVAKIANGNIEPPTPDTHTVTFTGDNATVTVDGKTVTSTTVKEGGSVQFTVTAAEGYEVKEVKAGEDVLEAVEGVYTLTDVKADTTVTITTEKVVVPESWIKYEATYENGVLKNVEITPNATPESVNNDETHKIFFWNEKMQPWTAE